MKKIILITVTILTIGFVNAQGKKDMSFGVKGGVNFATLTGDVENASMKVGFHVGGFVEVKISDRFSVQPELLFSTQGAKNEFSEDLGGGVTYSENDKINLSYLNVPVMAKFYVVDAFSLEAGLQIGFLMTAKNDFTATTVSSGVTTTESENVDIKDKLKSIGNTVITYYSSFDDKFVKGKIKSIGSVPYTWYTSFELRGGLKSGMYRRNIGGITYIVQ